MSQFNWNVLLGTIFALLGSSTGVFGYSSGSLGFRGGVASSSASGYAPGGSKTTFGEASYYQTAHRQWALIGSYRIGLQPEFGRWGSQELAIGGRFYPWTLIKPWTMQNENWHVISTSILMPYTQFGGKVGKRVLRVFSGAGNLEASTDIIGAYFSAGLLMGTSQFVKVEAAIGAERDFGIGAFPTKILTRYIALGVMGFI